MREGLATVSLSCVCHLSALRVQQHDFPIGTGRKDLFSVVSMQHPGQPSDDAWMGNALVDPARGKAHAPGPEERSGRTGLFDLMQQKILLDKQRGAGKQVRHCTRIAMVELSVLVKVARVFQRPCQGWANHTYGYGNGYGSRHIPYLFLSLASYFERV